MTDLIKAMMKAGTLECPHEQFMVDTVVQRYTNEITHHISAIVVVIKMKCQVCHQEFEFVRPQLPQHSPDGKSIAFAAKVPTIVIAR